MRNENVSAVSNDPHTALDEFFEFYSLENASEEMRSLIYYAVTHGDGEFETPLRKSEVLYFYERMKTLLNAAWTIRQTTTA